jgi:hypothetical protein
MHAARTAEQGASADQRGRAHLDGEHVGGAAAPLAPPLLPVRPVVGGLVQTRGQGVVVAAQAGALGAAGVAGVVAAAAPPLVGAPAAPPLLPDAGASPLPAAAATAVVAVGTLSGLLRAAAAARALPARTGRWGGTARRRAAALPQAQAASAARRGGGGSP